MDEYQAENEEMLSPLEGTENSFLDYAKSLWNSSRDNGAGTSQQSEVKNFEMMEDANSQV